MIVLDNDVLVKFARSDPNPSIVDQLRQYRDKDWTIPSLVAYEFYKACSNRSKMRTAQTELERHLDQIIEFSNDAALEAAYLDGKLMSQGINLDPVDLLNLATAHAMDGIFVTHNKNDFDKKPIHDIAEVEIFHTPD